MKVAESAPSSEDIIVRLEATAPTLSSVSRLSLHVTVAHQMPPPANLLEAFMRPVGFKRVRGCTFGFLGGPDMPAELTSVTIWLSAFPTGRDFVQIEATAKVRVVQPATELGPGGQQLPRAGVYARGNSKCGRSRRGRDY